MNTTDYGFVQVPVKPDQIERALVNAEQIPRNINNSIEGGDGIPIGCLGEIVFADFFGARIANTFHHDVVLSGHRIEVKTKKRTVRPENHFNGTVANFNAHQRCDFYAFVSITQRPECAFKDIRWAYLMGVIRPAAFHSQAVFYRKGDPDPQSPPGRQWYFRADCYNLPYEKLTRVPERSAAVS